MFRYDCIGFECGLVMDIAPVPVITDCAHC